MNKPKFSEYVLARPVQALPKFADARARKSLARKLVEAFGLSEEAAEAISNATVDPAAVRKSIGEPDDPQVECIPVPGGTLLGIRTTSWSRRIMPDPRNPRIGPSRRHPFAVDPGAGDDGSLFKPIPDPTTPDDAEDVSPELQVELESRHQLEWGCSQAADYVLDKNDWRESIESQGVMESVWVVATTYVHGDESDSATTLVTVEGSSRTTAVHKLLGVRSSDVPYDDKDQKLRKHIEALNTAYENGPDAEQAVALRCEQMPTLIIVGFIKHPTGSTTFPTAVKSMVALRHVDPPTPWGPGPENESLADEVLDELYRQDLISLTEREYFAGTCTKAEAEAAHLSADPVVRASKIAKLFISDVPEIRHAIRVAVTSQSTRKRISARLRNQLITALILRSVPANDVKRVDRIRRYMNHAFSKAAHKEQWLATDRPVDVLGAAALADVKSALADSSITETGPASLELAVRASYPLIVSGRLNADRGTQNNNQPDRRQPGEVLDAMRKTIQGVHQLQQALKDFSEGSQIRAVDESGTIRLASDGETEVLVNDVYLRNQFPAGGKAKAKSGGSTPLEIFDDALAEVEAAIAGVQQAFDTAAKVEGDDGRPLSESKGANPSMCDPWRKSLSDIGDELSFWSRTYRKVFGEGQANKASMDEMHPDDIEDEIEEEFDGAYENWDAEE